MIRIRAGIAFVVTACALAAVATATAAPTVYRPGNTSIAALRINANGSLTALPGSPFASGGTGGDSVVLTPEGSRLFIANQASHNISRFQVNADGTLTSAGAPAPSTSPLALTVTPDGKYLYVVGAGISIYSIGSAGELTPTAASPFTHPSLNGPRVPSVSPNGTFLFVPNNGGTNVVSFRINADGSLSHVDTEPTGGTGVVYSAITADGRRLYVNNWFSNTIAGFDVGSDGVLTPIAGSPFAAGAGTNPMGLRPGLNGQRLYAALFGADQLGVYEIAGSGALSAVPGGTVPAGVTEPGFLVQTSDGRRVHAAADGGGNDTPAFDVAATGLLSPVAGSPFASGVNGANFQSVAVTPNQGPTAHLAVNVTDRAARTADFDAIGSADADGSIATYFFNFGDGETQTGPSPTATHQYAAPGVYTATVTVTDNEGCSTAFLGTGQTASCNGGPRAVAQADVDVTAPPEPPPVDPPPDTDPPGLTVSGRRKQELGSSVFVKAGCDEPCTAAATGRLVVDPAPGGGRSAAKVARFKLKPKTKQLATGTKTKLKLKIPRRARSAGRLALSDQRATITAKLKVKATDAAGNASKGKRAVRLTG